LFWDYAHDRSSPPTLVFGDYQDDLTPH